MTLKTAASQPDQNPTSRNDAEPIKAFVNLGSITSESRFAEAVAEENQAKTKLEQASGCRQRATVAEQAALQEVHDKRLAADRAEHAYQEQARQAKGLADQEEAEGKIRAAELRREADCAEANAKQRAAGYRSQAAAVEAAGRRLVEDQRREAEAIANQRQYQATQEFRQATSLDIEAHRLLESAAAKRLSAERLNIKQSLTTWSDSRRTACEEMLAQHQRHRLLAEGGFVVAGLMWFGIAFGIYSLMQTNAVNLFALLPRVALCLTPLVVVGLLVIVLRARLQDVRADIETLTTSLRLLGELPVLYNTAVTEDCMKHFASALTQYHSAVARRPSLNEALSVPTEIQEAITKLVKACTDFGSAEKAIKPLSN